MKFISLNNKEKKIVKKWGNSGLLSGISSHLQENIAQLYENQASCLINENRTFGVNSSRAFDEILTTKKATSFISKIKSFFITVWNKFF